MNTLKHFWLDLVWLPIALIGTYILTGDNLSAVFSALTLAVLEISLSFDNAVLNAKKLESMNRFWRNMFLTVGMIVAVGVVRLYIPLLIVSTLGDVSLSGAASMAVNDHVQFQHILVGAHHMIAGFGAGFLGMLALLFFFDDEREVLWLKPIEQPLSHISKHINPNIISIVILLVLSGGTGYIIHDYHMITATVAGMIVFYLMEFIKNYLEKLDDKLASGAFSFLAGGFGTFLFLEVLDASMSLDGVVAAISITGDIVVVVGGLSIGALAIRSLTLKLVDDGTLTELDYIETGAFYSILLLALSMYVGLFVEIPEWFMGTVSAIIIIISAIASVKNNSKTQTA